ncbi:unnamed protein product [Trichobilharzia regenti]|nr:unnamed protein product [Trichobilharzia regenti]
MYYQNPIHVCPMHSSLTCFLVIVVFEKSFPDDQWVELDRTEIIQNNLNPDFAKKIVMEYHFEEQQRLNFAVLVLTFRSFFLQSNYFLKDELTLDLSGRMLDKKDIFGSSDPFLAFYRVNEDRR